MKLQADRYSLDIIERGTEFKEIVEVDVDNQTEVFRVPQHNDVDAMDMMNDFNLVSVWSNTDEIGLIKFYTVHGVWGANCSKIIEARTPCDADYYNINTNPLQSVPSFDSPSFFVPIHSS